MSMELLAVLPTADGIDAKAWQKALGKLGLPWRFEFGANPGVTRGFCPMRAGRVTSGIEIHDDDGEGIVGADVHDLPRVLAFRWSSDALEHACALSAAASFAEAFGAEIHDPAARPTRIDPAQLARVAAEATETALNQNRGVPTVAQVVRAISQMDDMGWRHVVGGRILTRSVDGPYLRGILVDRTSGPGAFTLYAMQQLWCTTTGQLTLNHSFRFVGVCGGLKWITDGLRDALARDAGAKKCVGAEPSDPMVGDRRLGSDNEDAQPNTWVERAIMRALDGDTSGARPALKRAAERFPDHHDQYRSLRMLPALVSTIERGESVGAMLHPLTQEAKARFVIKPVRVRRAAGQAASNRSP